MNHMTQGFQEEPRELIECPECFSKGCPYCNYDGVVEKERPNNLF